MICIADSFDDEYPFDGGNRDLFDPWWNIDYVFLGMIL